MRAARLTGERKPVTALFVDVVGSTRLAEQIDPEDWTALINEAFDLMSRAVFRYEGTIAQLQGDALLAFFGAPVAHEDDPERAILAALDMLDATDEFARQLKATQGIDFRIRAGINSGPVMVGNVGSDLRYEYTALGDAVNVAARMQTAAEPGTIVITEMTRRLTGDTFDLDDLGEIEVKGKTEPIHAFRVIGRKAAPARRRGLESVGLDSPMVGRAEQLERLTSLLDIIAAGRGRAAFIVGEPGIGKSRLLAELKIAALAPPSTTRWFEGRCVSYGRNCPTTCSSTCSVDPRLLVLRDGVGGARRSTPPSSTSWAWTRPRPRTPRCTSPTCSACPCGRGRRSRPKRRTYSRAVTSRRRTGSCAGWPRAGRSWWSARTSTGPTRRPSTSPASSCRSRASCPSSSSRRCAPRRTPRAGPSSATRGSCSARRSPRSLEPLTEADSKTLVANLLEIRSLPARVRDLILARSEGNPFFVEEVVRMLIERGAIVQEGTRWVATADVASIEIPETLHGLLLARIDQLPDDAIRVAAVIGRQFPCECWSA